MSCPDWVVLTRDQQRDPAVDPRGWAEARTHLRACPRCREQALSCDPVLLFQLLPEPRASADEVAAMQQGVAALIRAGRVVDRVSGRVSARSRRAALASRVAAAAALIVAVLSMQPAPVREPRTSAEADAWMAAAAELPVQPLIDELDLAQARVYELGSDGVAVVMVVDANFDV